MLYISIEDIKNHLNIDTDFIADDKYLGQLIEVAQGAVERNIDRKLEDLEDVNGQLPETLLQAVKFLVGNYYANRESVAFAATHDVPHSYQYLIDLYRDYRGVTPSQCVCNNS